MSDVKLLVGTGVNDDARKDIIGAGSPHTVGATDPNPIPITPNWVDDTNCPALRDSEPGSHFTKLVQVGSALYVPLRNGDTDIPHNITIGSVFRMYKSTDGGLTWTEMDSANAPFFALASNWPIPPTVFRSGSTLYLVGISRPALDGSGSSQIKLVPFDTSTDTWGTQDLWGFLPGTQSDAYRLGILAGIRPDGSLITAYSAHNGTFIGQVLVKKRVGATWTTLATLGGTTSDWVELEGGCLDKDGNLQLFLSRSTDVPPNSGAQFSLYHLSISAASDAVSAYHLIESNIEGDSLAHGFVNAGGYGCSWYAQPCNKVGHCYGYRTENNFTWYNTFGEMHFVLLDLTADPLNPVITQSVITSTQSGYEPDQSQDCAAAFHDGQWWGYWSTQYPGLPNGTLQRRVWRSGSADGATGWSAPAVVASSSQSDRGIVDVCLAPPSSFAPAGGILPFMADDIPMGTTGTSGGGDCGGGGSGGGPAMY